MQLPVDHPLIILTGPTAVGKTTLSLKIVARFNGEIISADSRLFYRGLDIGTAKPSQRERGKIPHHLIDIADPDETLSLAVFQQSVYEIAENLWQRNKIPFLVGGTGQFIRAIMEGWVIPPQQPNKRMREYFNAWGEKIGPSTLHEKLHLIDPAAAEKINPRNLRRTVRALEVIFSTGKLFSCQRKKKSRGLNLKVIGLIRERKTLYERVDRRIEKMFADGFVEEVESLLAQGYDPNLPSLSAIGYREVINYLRGNITMEDVVRLMKRRTRSYIRRQANWFKPDDPRIAWFEMREGIEDEIFSYIKTKEGWQNG